MTVTGALRKVADAGADAFGPRRHAVLLLSVLLLAGCPGTTAAPGAGLPDSGMPVPGSRTVVPPLPRMKPAPPSTMPPAATAAAATAPSDAALSNSTLANTATSNVTVAALPDPLPLALPMPPPPTPNADPDALVGLDQVQTIRLLGVPVAREEAPPAKVWRYAKGDCTLKVFFFMDMTSSQDFRALSYDMKSSNNVPDADHRCFAQLIAQAGAAGGPERGNVRND